MGIMFWKFSGNSDFLKAKLQVCVPVKHIIYYHSSNIMPMPILIILYIPMHRTVHHTHTVF